MAWRLSYAHRLGEAVTYGKGLSEEVAKIFFFFRRLFCMQQRLPRGLQEDRGNASRLLLIDETLSLLLDYLLIGQYFLHLPSHTLFFLPFFGIMQLLFYENKAHMYDREQP